ncbi:DgaE family pyridoxal phosphate-dependent ammonia lyase [Vagococcus fessus]|uniref:L-seryl-tRNA selenium transferase n=1 Tax=Vagococcus fessus TaxID=120370 RepID=A0A430ADB0_9ENTE|nr:DgaE family pyridoxal phosphate-dependent ammonia lyase [Vagococcus fessus]RSU05206.1 L-seryl-tRNA selenium transferase [Vagococcus fessus]
MQSSHEKYQLKEVINASGKMTILGVSKVSKKVQEAQIEGGNNFYEMSELMSQTGNYIANLVGVEGARVVSSASAGIAQSIAAVIGKGSRYHLYHPYEDRGEAREIIIPKGHNVDYGTGIDVMIAQGGGKIVEAGYSNRCTPEDIEMMITDKTAAILYVKSHHTVQKSMLTIQEAIEVAHRHKLPLILDAAAEEELSYYVELGADLIIFSGAKAIEGPSSGLVVGKQPYMEWVSMQSLGMARSMKIGKENVLGFTQAIEDYLANGSEDGESMKRRLVPFLENLNTLTGITATCVQDGAGREIYRAEVKVSENLDAKEVIRELKAESPAVYTREYRANNGIIEFDIRAVSEDEMTKIVERLRTIVTE